MEENLFTPKLVDIVVPIRKASDGKQKFNDIFLIMNYYSQNLSSVFTDIDSNSFTENHVKIIMYNMLCALNFLHSANLIHRDIKPANILLTNRCNVLICDFGLARTLP